MTQQEEARKSFLSAKKLFKDNKIEEARLAFDKAYRLDPENPLYMSYHGMAEALRFHKIGYGLELCTKAIKKEFFKAEYYANLGRVYIAAGNKKGAITALKKGLRFDVENDDIHELLVSLGVRKRQIIPFLPRSNFINKYLGLIFRRVLPSMTKKSYEDELESIAETKDEKAAQPQQPGKQPQQASKQPPGKPQQ